MSKDLKEQTRVADKFFTESFNSKSFEYRQEYATYCLQTQINQIKIERQRLLNNYRMADNEARKQQEHREIDLRRHYNQKLSEVL